MTSLFGAATGSRVLTPQTSVVIARDLIVKESGLTILTYYNVYLYPALGAIL